MKQMAAVSFIHDNLGFHDLSSSSEGCGSV